MRPDFYCARTEAGHAKAAVLQRWCYGGGSVGMSAIIKKLVFSAAGSLLFLGFVVPLLNNAAESIGAATTAIMVATFSVSAAGLIAEATSWCIGNWTRLTTPKSKGHTATIQQPSPVATPVVEQQMVPEQQEPEKEQLLARIEALETRLKEMNKPEQQTVAAPAPVSPAPAPMVVTPASKAAVPSPVQQQQLQQKKSHVEVLLGGAS